MTKYLTRSKLREGGFILTHSIRELSPLWQEKHGDKLFHGDGTVELRHLGSGWDRKHRDNTQTIMPACLQPDSCRAKKEGRPA